jgi:hypothetical protein
MWGLVGCNLRLCDRILLYSDVVSPTGWDIAVACAICIWIFFVFLQSPYK